AHSVTARAVCFQVPWHSLSFAVLSIAGWLESRLYTSIRPRQNRYAITAPWISLPNRNASVRRQGHHNIAPRKSNKQGTKLSAMQRKKLVSLLQRELFVEQNSNGSSKISIY